MVAKLREAWLSLSGAAQMLGVHPSTVRLWSNQGNFPVHRTSGGHRRYLRSEVELWMKTSQPGPALEPESAMQSAIGQLRMRVADGRLEAEAWYQKLDENARVQYRQGGLALVRGLMNYLSGEAQAASAAKLLGYEYAARARRAGLTNLEATQAFLFFRNGLLEALVNAYDAARVPPGLAWSHLLSHFHAFTDLVLLNLLETYGILSENQA